jgi:hypothetical protein
MSKSYFSSWKNVKKCQKQKTLPHDQGGGYNLGQKWATNKLRIEILCSQLIAIR